MRKKSLIIFDVFISVIIIIGLCFGIKTSIERANLTGSKFLAENKDLNFDFTANPDYQKVLAGSTVKIKVNVKNIKMGEVRTK